MTEKPQENKDWAEISAFARKMNVSPEEIATWAKEDPRDFELARLQFADFDQGNATPTETKTSTFTAEDSPTLASPERPGSDETTQAARSAVENMLRNGFINPEAEEAQQKSGFVRLRNRLKAIFSKDTLTVANAAHQIGLYQSGVKNSNFKDRMKSRATAHEEDGKKHRAKLCLAIGATGLAGTLAVGYGISRLTGIGFAEIADASTHTGGHSTGPSGPSPDELHKEAKYRQASGEDHVRNKYVTKGLDEDLGPKRGAEQLSRLYTHRGEAMQVMKYQILHGIDAEQGKAKADYMMTSENYEMLEPGGETLSKNGRKFADWLQNNLDKNEVKAKYTSVEETGKYIINSGIDEGKLDSGRDDKLKIGSALPGNTKLLEITLPAGTELWNGDELEKSQKLYFKVDPAGNCVNIVWEGTRPVYESKKTTFEGGKTTDEGGGKTTSEGGEKTTHEGGKTTAEGGKNPAEDINANPHIPDAIKVDPNIPAGESKPATPPPPTYEAPAPPAPEPEDRPTPAPEPEKAAPTPGAPATGDPGAP